MNKRKIYYFGFLTPILFVFTAILGGALRPGYSHISNTVSELFSHGSPNRTPLTILYLIFAILLSIYGVSLLCFVFKFKQNKWSGIVAAGSFLVVGILNILTATVFPQDPWGSTLTYSGEMHMKISGVITLFSLLYILMFGIWFKKVHKESSFLLYSILTIFAAIFSGLWFITNFGSPIMGLTERVAILIGFQWTIALTVMVLHRERTLMIDDLTA
jgi:hypothetical protein